MRKLILGSSLAAFLACWPAIAESVDKSKQQDVVPQFATGQLTPTPEMWFYQEDLRHYQDSKMAVRQKAEYRLAQRQQRVAALKWYGFSNSRPVACPDPYNSDSSPHWTGGAANYPYRWVQTARPWILVQSRVAGMY